MIPRLHKRGTSFKGVCSYILHDAAKTSSDRVLWTDKLNIFSHADDAWFEMFTVARDQAALKQQSGHDARGRKNTKPALHYTLSWAVSDKPSPQHMRETALSSLKALKLDQHQVLMAAHGDKEHLHVHIVVNTIHPETGLTAPLKYTKENLSRWAEAYEKQHGIHCEERIKNNEARDNICTAKRATEILMQGHGSAVGFLPPYVPIKHEPLNRRLWFDKKDITDRMKRLRAEIDLGQKVVRNATWEQQKGQRDELDRDTRAACNQARDHVRKSFRPHWRDLYRAQRKEMKYVTKDAAHPLERAVFVFSQRERLGLRKPLSVRQMIDCIRNPGKLLDRLDAVHERERRNLGQMQKVETVALTDRIWILHQARFNRLCDEQAAYRKAERDQHYQNTRTVTFHTAKGSLIKEMPRPVSKPRSFDLGDRPDPVAQQFREASATSSKQQISRAEAIKQQMEEWRKRNPGRDFGREM